METTGAMEVLRATPLTAGLGHPELRRLARHQRAIAKRFEAIGGATCG